MVSKCANPGCSTPFLYMHEGRLYRVELDRLGDGSTPDLGHIQLPRRRTEFFWLCDHCAGRMTIVFEKGEGIKVLPLGTGRTAA